MEPIDVCIDPALVPEGSRPIIKAKDQPQYLPLPSIMTPDGRVITRWSLTEAERAAILRGDDIFLVVHTFNAPLQPVALSVGPCDWRD